MKRKNSGIKGCGFSASIGMSLVFDLNEDEALALLPMKLSVRGVNTLPKAIRHVPKK